MGVPGSANFLLAGAQGYQIERSLRFNSPDSAYLNRTPATAGNRTTWTWSGWVKRSGLGTDQGVFEAGSTSNQTSISFSSSANALVVQDYTIGSYNLTWATTAVFRDIGAWYHLIIAYDTTQASSANAVKIYINGLTQAVSFNAYTGSYSQNRNSYINSTSSHRVGTYNGTQNYLDGLLTEVHFIDGQALTPSSFGETDTITGVWKPKRYAGTYGTNGFYLKFADNSGTTSTTLDKDSSGNGNNWTPNNFSVTAGAGNDSLIDTPTPYADGGNGRGNYCTLNPLDKSSSTLSNGNLDVTVSAGISSLAFGNFEMRSGKWYWEVVPTAVNAAMIGIADADKAIGTRTWEQPNGWYYYNTGSKYNNSTDTSYGASYTTNDVIGVAYDADGGSVTFYKNGTSQGSAFTGLTGKGIVPALNNGASAVSEPYVCNFGQRSFSYTPPSGFLALNTQNLPEPSIKKPSSYMDVKLYTGNGTSQTISGLGFSPDLVWIKKRSAAENHEVQDTVRGATKRLASNTTDVESTVAGSISAFTSDGFSVGNAGTTNENTSTYAAWCWDESATPGFDIVTYTGTGVARTIAHSLGVAPSMIIVKERGNANDWPVYHASTGNLKALYLNLTNGQGGDFAGAWNSTSPTSSVFSLGTSVETNRNTGTYVAYLWSEVAGFSKFGSYTGNGSSDGPFVFCGFRPRWVMTKRTDTTSNWMIMDAGRNPSNVADNQLYPNRSDAEAGASSSMDLTSNGFKLRNTGSDFNAATATYIFAAFAESPQKYSLAR